MNFGDSLMSQYKCFGFYLYFALVGGLASMYSPVSYAANLFSLGNVDTSYMSSNDSIKNHVKWIKIVISSNAGEETVEIKDNHTLAAQDMGLADNLEITWIWQLPNGVSGDDVTHGLFPHVLTGVSKKVVFSFYDLGTIHGRFVGRVTKLTKRKDFSKAGDQFELANDFYDKIRGLDSTRLSTQANSWNYALYQAGYNEAHQVGVRRIDQTKKEKIRAWLKEWIRLCMEQQSLKSRLGGALQSWSKFSKLAYSRVSDWPDTVLQDITDDKLEKIFLKRDFRDWMIEDMDWLQDTVFKNQSVHHFLDGKSYLSALVPNNSESGTSLSKFAQAITAFAKEWKVSSP